MVISSEPDLLSFARPQYFQAGRFRLPLGHKTYLMGILNVTPDSFSDGGRYISPDRAVSQACDMLLAGADLIDVGGESTRPGSHPVSEQEEISRVVPVIEQLVRHCPCPVSVDTYKPVVAEAALAAGACIINDVYGLHTNEEMARIAARYQAGIIMMHNARFYRPEEKDYAGPAIQVDPEQIRTYRQGDLWSAISKYLKASICLARKAGLLPEQLMVDPGIGFGVSAVESIEIIRQLEKLSELNLPVLIGPSRKRFIGELTGQPVEQRQFGTAAAIAISIAKGADMVRVHDIAAIRDTIQVCDALVRRTPDEAPDLP